MNRDRLSERFRRMYEQDPGLHEHPPEILASHLLRITLAGMTRRLEEALDRLTAAIDRQSRPEDE